MAGVPEGAVPGAPPPEGEQRNMCGYRLIFPQSPLTLTGHSPGRVHHALSPHLSAMSVQRTGSDVKIDWAPMLMQDIMLLYQRIALTCLGGWLWHLVAIAPRSALCGRPSTYRSSWVTMLK